MMYHAYFFPVLSAPPMPRKNRRNEREIEQTNLAVSYFRVPVPRQLNKSLHTVKMRGNIGWVKKSYRREDFLTYGYSNDKCTPLPE